MFHISISHFKEAIFDYTYELVTSNFFITNFTNIGWLILPRCSCYLSTIYNSIVRQARSDTTPIEYLTLFLIYFMYVMYS